MLFREIYGSYFQVVAAILKEAVSGNLTDRKMTDLVREKGFSESSLFIPAALKSGAWPLLDKNLHSVLRHEPTMPLTTLEKRWLKALLLDPRIALFAPDPTGLEGMEPLYGPENLVYYDRYGDGDPYRDKNYIANFRLILKAIRERRWLRVRFVEYRGNCCSAVLRPYHLEYSAKDDKFRLLAAQKKRLRIINVARICSCELLEEYKPEKPVLPLLHEKELTLLVHDERNGLERVLLHFSHFEKETQKLEENMYQIKLRYDREDETELLIRVLSFGPVLEVTAPNAFIELVKARIARQLDQMPGG